MALRLQERLRFITEAGKILSSSLQSPHALQRLAELISVTIADVCTIDLYGDDGTKDRIAKAFPKDLDNFDEIISGAVGRPDPVFLVPLPIDGGTLGVMSLVRLGKRIDPEDLTLAEEVARLAAMSVENARLYHTAQEALLTVRLKAADIRRMNEELERRVVERTLELEAANREMSIINYTVSHDLRAPLRAIQGYSQMLVEDFGGELPSQATQYLEKLNGCTKEVSQLLDGLLNFCKVGSHPLKKEVIHLDEIVGQAVETLRTRMVGRNVDLRIDKLPDDYGDRMLVKQIFVNLISNALTYSAVRAIPTIEIGQQLEDGVAEAPYFVRDNGIGFDPEDAPKLFEAFRRLHTDSEYEGTGVGLAIVAGIVQRHGGRVWAEGMPGHGATFYFTLGPDQFQKERIAS